MTLFSGNIIWEGQQAGSQYLLQLLKELHSKNTTLRLCRLQFSKNVWGAHYMLGPELGAFTVQGLAYFILTVVPCSHSKQIHQTILSYRG